MRVTCTQHARITHTHNRTPVLARYGGAGTTTSHTPSSYCPTSPREVRGREQCAEYTGGSTLHRVTHTQVVTHTEPAQEDGSCVRTCMLCVSVCSCSRVAAARGRFGMGEVREGKGLAGLSLLKLSSLGEREWGKGARVQVCMDVGISNLVCVLCVHANVCMLGVWCVCVCRVCVHV